MTTHARPSGPTPTDEQLAIVAHAAGTKDLTVEALAGTGKTSTLRMFAHTASSRSGQYIAFNRAIVDEARQAFPSNVTCSTAHSLAMRAVGRPYAHRLNYPRLTNAQLAAWLQCKPFTFRHEGVPHVLTEDQVARHALATVQQFCKSTDEQPHAGHVPEVPLVVTNPETAAEFAAFVTPIAQTLWADITDPVGRLSYSHDYYLKIWHLSRPRITADFILFDEAQDADPVMLDVVSAQEHAQLVFCGDDYQTLYEWRGAQNALASVRTDARLWLTRSFRFGPDIAALANVYLERLGSPHPIAGSPEISSRVEAVADPDAILCRTNGAVIQSLVEAEALGKKAAVVGGIRDLESFSVACRQLQSGHRVSHPALAPFRTWSEVRDWIDKNPEQSPDIAQRVKMVERHGPERIRQLLSQTVEEAHADVTVSTVHQAKGRQWDRVRIANDFPDLKDMSPEELRVAYVAVTRARHSLDTAGLKAGTPSRSISRAATPPPRSAPALPPVPKPTSPTVEAAFERPKRRTRSVIPPVPGPTQPAPPGNGQPTPSRPRRWRPVPPQHPSA